MAAMAAASAKKRAKKKQKQTTVARRKREAAATDKKVAAAELAFAFDPSAQNKAAVQQARAKVCAARAKLGRPASAEEGGSESGDGGQGRTGRATKE